MACPDTATPVGETAGTTESNKITMFAIFGMVALPAVIMASAFAENIHGRKQKYSHSVQEFLKDGNIDENERWSQRNCAEGLA
ncbi:MAG: hypothetical protein OER22_05340 [Gammaproteobacteria bacterium]|nr:hypothetical protein [Gammaproteobacteria bacterium]